MTMATDMDMMDICKGFFPHRLLFVPGWKSVIRHTAAWHCICVAWYKMCSELYRLVKIFLCCYCFYCAWSIPSVKERFSDMHHMHPILSSTALTKVGCRPPCRKSKLAGYLRVAFHLQYAAREWVSQWRRCAVKCAWPQLFPAGHLIAPSKALPPL